MDVLARDVTFAALDRALAALSLRQSLIAQNIANVNTPNYKRRDVSFTEELASALSGAAEAGAAETAGALAERPEREQRVARVMQTVAHDVVAKRLFYRADMGGVDLDREMAEQAKATLMYAAMAQLAQEKIRQYRTIIKEGRV